MCGIVGVMFLNSGEKTQYKSYAEDYCKVFTSMLLEAQVLGRDATGMFSAKCAYNMSTKGTMKVFKEATPASNFVKLAKYHQMIGTTSNGGDFSATEGLYLVGHCRGATHGNPKDNRNNHPFVCGNIVGVHNGIISNYHDIIKSMPEVVVEGTCDSESIFSMINMFNDMEEIDGIKEAITSTANLLDGWFACVGTDKTSYPSLFFFRDGSGQLDFVYEKTNRVLLFATESMFIEKALHANHIKGDFEEKQIGDNEGLIINALGNGAFEDGDLFSLVDGASILEVEAEGATASEEPAPPVGVYEVSKTDTKSDSPSVASTETVDMVRTNLARNSGSEDIPSAIDPLWTDPGASLQTLSNED